MNNLNHSVSLLIGWIAKASLDDEHWKIFGFKSRPKRGRAFDKFIDKNKLAKEDFLMKELFLLSTIDVIQAIKSKNLSEENKLTYLIGVLSQLFLPFSQSKIFDKNINYLNFIKNGVDDYLNQRFIDSFILRVKRLFDNDIAMNIIAGGIILSESGSKEQKNGLIFDRKIIAQKISIEIENDKLDFPLEINKLGIYKNFALEILKLVSKESK